MLKNLYRLLEIPFIYRLSQHLFTPGGAWMLPPVLKKAYGLSFQLTLDVGCGPVLNTPEPAGMIVGVDINPAYIRKYTGGSVDEDPKLVVAPVSSRRRLGYVSSSDQLPFADALFDEARSFGLFHHLTDSQTAGTLREMNRCLKPGGRMMVLDAVLPVRAWARPLAWLTRRLDRGAYMRKQEELLALFQDACPGSWTWERNTYSLTGLELLSLQYIKN